MLLIHLLFEVKYLSEFVRGWKWIRNWLNLLFTMHKFWVYFLKWNTSDRFQTSHTYVFWLVGCKYDHENWRKWHRQGQNLKKYIFYVFHITSINISFWEKCLVVRKDEGSSHQVSSVKCWILLPASWRKGCRLVQVLFTCFTRYYDIVIQRWKFRFVCFLDLVCYFGLRKKLTRFAIFGFVRIFWIWFIVFAERTKLLGNFLVIFKFWICS